MDNRLGYLLMNEMSDNIRSKGNSQYKPLQISLFINGKLAVKEYCKKSSNISQMSMQPLCGLIKQSNKRVLISILFHGI